MKFNQWQHSITITGFVTTQITFFRASKKTKHFALTKREELDFQSSLTLSHSGTYFFIFFLNRSETLCTACTIQFPAWLFVHRLPVHVWSYWLVASFCDGVIFRGRGMLNVANTQMSEVESQCVFRFGYSPDYVAPRPMNMQTTRLPYKKENAMRGTHRRNCESSVHLCLFCFPLTCFRLPPLHYSSASSLCYFTFTHEICRSRNKYVRWG